MNHPRWRLPQPALAHPRIATAATICLGLSLAAWLALAPPWAPALSTAPVPTAEPPADAVADPPTVAPATEIPSAESPFAGIDQTPAPPARTGIATYEVQSGDVLWQIAERFGLRTETLLWANDLPNPDLLLIGQKLAVPPVDGVMYTVRPDDHLSDVAQRYGVDANAIVAANHLSSADQLVAGVDIFLPGGRPLQRAASAANVVQAPPDGEQQAAILAPPIPLPPNIDEILNAGWVRTTGTAVLYKTADPAGKQLQQLPAASRLERLEGFNGGRIEVRDPGDGRTLQAMTGWVDADDLDVGRAPSPRELPLGYPANAAMDIAQVFAPYRSQLDGSPYALANCGPTSIGMALAAFGVNVPPSQLRAETLDDQHMWGNNAGTVMTALADVVEKHGLQALDLHADDGGINRWTLDDIRGHIALGHPVVVQVRYRSLPGRANVPYFQDHYILVTAVVPDGFLYNDPIDADGVGWDRFIASGRLDAAMNATDGRYAHAAFAVSA